MIHTGCAGFGKSHPLCGDEDLARLEEACRPFDEVHVLFNTASMWDDAPRFQGRPAGRGH